MRTRLEEPGQAARRDLARNRAAEERRQRKPRGEGKGGKERDAHRINARAVPEEGTNGGRKRNPQAENKN